jgi:uncharacterized membrane protein
VAVVDADVVFPDRALANRQSVRRRYDRAVATLAMPAVRPGVIVIVTALAAASYAIDWRSPLRFAITLLFMLFIPGLALSELVPLPGHLERLVFALGTSIAIETLLAVLLVYTGMFTPGRVFAAVAGLAVAAAAARVFITVKAGRVA